MKKGSAREKIAEECQLSSEELMQEMDLLHGEGYLSADGRITSSGIEVLSPYKVKNAIILAAGFSSRCAPLSFEKPKGLFRVRGEILIERQIQQLQERGIREIYVVVGYMKELFFYLEKKFQVHIITNTEYMIRNNLSSLYAAKNYFGNSFICYSDNYILHNGYEEYVYDSYFAAMYSEEYTDEYIIRVDENDAITQYFQGGSGSWYQMGEMYFTEAEASKLISMLEEEYDYSSVYDMKIDDFYIRHLSEFTIFIKRYPENAVKEFDTIAEIETFDSTFFQNMGGNILSNIQEILECRSDEIRDVHQIKVGLTNVTFSFLCCGKKYIYRHPGIGTERFIDRKREAQAQELAREMALDYTTVHFDSKEGWKLCEFYEHFKFDYANEKDENRGIALIQKLHKEPKKLGWELNMLEGAEKFQKMIPKEYYDTLHEFGDLRAEICMLYGYAKSDGYEIEMCHNDVSDANILCGKNDTILIDWEYAADNDPAADIASFIIGGKHSSEECDTILEKYFGRKLIRQERRHYYAYIAISGYYWFSWAIYMESMGNSIGELTYILYSYAKKYAPIALNMYQGDSVYDR